MSVVPILCFVPLLSHLPCPSLLPRLHRSFVLLSESDIPLYDPLTLHQQLLAEGKSRVNACWHPGRSEWRWSNIMKVCDD